MSGRILITPRSLTRYPDPALRRLEEAGFELVFSKPGETPSETELLDLLPGCVGWIAGVEPVSATVLQAASGSLRVISRNGTGVDNLPLETAASLGIEVRRADGANARGVAELAIALILASLRHIPAQSARLKRGDWHRRVGAEIGGRVVGIVGCGAVGQLVARAALGLGARVIGFDPLPNPMFQPDGPFRWSALDELLDEATVVSLHCPPLPDGTPLLSVERLARMQRGVHIVNTARAGLVDEAALLAALNADQIGGYATDVFATEPPDISPLLSHERVIATPHIGGFTSESVSNATVAAVDNLVRALAG